VRKDGPPNAGHSKHPAEGSHGWFTRPFDALYGLKVTNHNFQARNPSQEYFVAISVLEKW
jgi:hypothetical protein